MATSSVRWLQKARPPRDALVCETEGRRVYQAQRADGTLVVVGGGSGGRVHAEGMFLHLLMRKDKQRIPGVVV